MGLRKCLWERYLVQRGFYTLKDRLDKIKGKFILSLNDVPEVRELFKDYQMTHRKIRWSVNSKAAHEDHNGNELIIYNFDLF